MVRVKAQMSYLDRAGKAIARWDKLAEPPAAHPAHRNGLFDAFDGGATSVPRRGWGYHTADLLSEEALNTIRQRAAEASHTLCSLCDVDGDGQVGLLEVREALLTHRHLLTLIGLTYISTEEKIAEFFLRADADGSGNITEEELASFLTDRFVGDRRHRGEDDAGQDVTHRDYVNRQTHGFDQSMFVVGGPTGHSLNPYASAERGVRANGGRVAGSVHPRARESLSRRVQSRGDRHDRAAWQGRGQPSFSGFFHDNDKGSPDGRMAAEKFFEPQGAGQSLITYPSQQVFFRLH